MSGGVVGTRKMKVNARYIRGFICPDFAEIAAALSNKNESKEIDMSKEELPGIAGVQRPVSGRVRDRVVPARMVRAKVEIVIDDSGGYLLPSTGSVGTGGLLAAGTALLAGAVLVLVSGVRKRRR